MRFTHNKNHFKVIDCGQISACNESDRQWSCILCVNTVFLTIKNPKWCKRKVCHATY